VEPSFVPGAIDRMMRVPDAASVASVRVLERLLGRRAGASTGTGLWAAFRIISEMRERGEQGSVVGLLCDPGERYVEKYYADAWLVEQGMDIAPYLACLEQFLDTGLLNGPEAGRAG
jgi:cysteine synthase A